MHHLRIPAKLDEAHQRSQAHNMQPIRAAEGWRVEADSAMPAQVASKCSRHCCWYCNHRWKAANQRFEATRLMHSSSARQPCSAGTRHNRFFCVPRSLLRTHLPSVPTHAGSERRNRTSESQSHKIIRPSRLLQRYHFTVQILRQPHYVHWQCLSEIPQVQNTSRTLQSGNPLSARRLQGPTSRLRVESQLRITWRQRNLGKGHDYKL